MKEKSQIKILLVDDDPDIVEFMSYNLKKETYTVFVAENGIEAIKKAKKHLPDLIILDVMMPEMDGMQVCEALRKEKTTADILICFLTARAEDFSQIAGFNVGADDYVTKPVKPAVFLKKVEALLRRAEKSAFSENSKFSIEGMEIDFGAHSVIINGKSVILAKKEFLLLKLFVSSPGKVFSREEIYSFVWGNEVVVGDRTIDVHIRKLREKIGDNRIITLKGIGYKFNIN
ncbi:MAG: response regulator transcription factor [Bacteroidales bacterium]|nr:response regulator transcription factor [Bacteroidales bacterium]MDD3859454.1 response regulator transcription factor [Bacteroidales bacterium]